MIDVLNYDEKKIVRAIKKAISKDFKKKLINLKNPYGDGKSSNKIVEYLLNTNIDKKLFFKEITY